MRLRLLYGIATFDAQMPQVIHYEQDFGIGLLSEDLALQVALVDADDERHTNAISEDALGQREGELFFVLLLEVHAGSEIVTFYLSLPFSSNSDSLNFL